MVFELASPVGSSQVPDVMIMQTSDVGSTAQPPLAHLAFFEAAGDQTEGQPEYRAAVAGLLAMRLVDRWVLAGAGDRPPTLRELEAVRRAIEHVDDGPVREILRNLDAALTTSWGKLARHVPVVLAAYGGILKKEGLFACAADVYSAVAAVAPLCDGKELVPPAYLEMGYCFRMVGGRLAEAERAYRRAGAIANLQGDEYNALLSRIGLASVQLNRGNLPAAQETLDTVISEIATRPLPVDGPLKDVLARARHDRGVVAYQRKDYQTAAAFIHAAVNDYSDELRRTTALCDLGTAMVDLGLPDAANDAYLVVYRTSPNRYWHTIAGLNLMRLAFLRDQETVFERYRQELSVGLAAPQEAAYHQLVGEGLYRFGREDAAREALTRAVDIATRCQLNQIRLESEALLTEIVLGRRPKATFVEVQPPPLVRPVVHALRDMREQVGV
jgi:tetratricopeptide (TPR) repeat protein